MRAVREQLGATSFNYLTEVINEVTEVHVALRTDQDNSNVDIVKGVDILQSNVSVVEARLVTDDFGQFQPMSDEIRHNVEQRITAAFLTCLQSMTQDQKVVLFFDTLEKASDQVNSWLTDHLLWPIRERRLPGVIVIMAGRTLIDLDRSWNDWVAKTGLELFADEHVAEYMAKLRLQDRLSTSLEDLMKLTRRHPGLLGQVTKNIMLDELVDEDEEWI